MSNKSSQYTHFTSRDHSVVETSTHGARHVLARPDQQQLNLSISHDSLSHARCIRTHSGTRLLGSGSDRPTR